MPSSDEQSARFNEIPLAENNLKLQTANKGHAMAMGYMAMPYTPHTKLCSVVQVQITIVCQRKAGNQGVTFSRECS